MTSRGATRALALALLAAGTASADTLSVMLVDPGELALPQQQKLVRAAQAVAHQLTSLTVIEWGASDAARRRCGEDDACLRAHAAATHNDHAVLLQVKGSGAGLQVSAAVVDVARKRVVKRSLRFPSADEPQEAMARLLDSVLPGYVRKGWGGVLLDGELGSRVKVDGKVVALLPLLDPLAVPAGTHELDVLFPSGQALLRRVQVLEGKLLRVEVSVPGHLAKEEIFPGARSSILRGTSYALWSAGALSVAASLVAGAFARASLGRLRPCTIDRTSCLDIEQAQAEQVRADRYARNANVLLVTGVSLGAAGAGLFTVDLVLEGRE